jgi:hypothetical protein
MAAQQCEHRADEEQLVPDAHGADADEEPGDEVGAVHHRPVAVHARDVMK